MIRTRIALLATTLFCATTAQALASPVLLMVAGGGGGAGFNSGGGSGQAGTTAQAGNSGGTAGVSESGGGGGGTGGGGGGAGANDHGYAGGSAGGSGGLAYPGFGLAGAYGGGTGAYGGGGGGGSNGGGGGGGYNGGGGGGGGAAEGGGGGGSSFLAAAFSKIVAIAGKNAGLGSISIEFGNSTESFSYTGGSQSYDVSTTGVYDLTASGGQGGNVNFFKISHAGGRGATVSGAITLTAGTVLDIEVGGMGGINGDQFGQSGGGGGSWVYEISAPTPVPEPGSLALLGTALIGLGVMVRRRRKGG